MLELMANSDKEEALKNPGELNPSTDDTTKLNPIINRNAVTEHVNVLLENATEGFNGNNNYLENGKCYDRYGHFLLQCGNKSGAFEAFENASKCFKKANDYRSAISAIEWALSIHRTDMAMDPTGDMNYKDKAILSSCRKKLAKLNNKLLKQHNDNPFAEHMTGNIRPLSGSEVNQRNCISCSVNHNSGRVSNRFHSVNPKKIKRLSRTLKEANQRLNQLNQKNIDHRYIIDPQNPGTRLKCQLCSVSIKSERLSAVKDHLRTKIHIQKSNAEELFKMEKAKCSVNVPNISCHENYNLNLFSLSDVQITSIGIPAESSSANYVPSSTAVCDTIPVTSSEDVESGLIDSGSPILTSTEFQQWLDQLNCLTR